MCRSCLGLGCLFAAFAVPYMVADWRKAPHIVVKRFDIDGWATIFFEMCTPMATNGRAYRYHQNIQKYQNKTYLADSAQPAGRSGGGPLAAMIPVAMHGRFLLLL